MRYSKAQALSRDERRAGQRQEAHAQQRAQLTQAPIVPTMTSPHPPSFLSRRMSSLLGPTRFSRVFISRFGTAASVAPRRAASTEHTELAASNARFRSQALFDVEDWAVVVRLCSLSFLQ
jgi:hypothetical protein